MKQKLKGGKEKWKMIKKLKLDHFENIRGRIENMDLPKHPLYEKIDMTLSHNNSTENKNEIYSYHLNEWCLDWRLNEGPILLDAWDGIISEYNNLLRYKGRIVKGILLNSCGDEIKASGELIINLENNYYLHYIRIGNLGGNLFARDLWRVKSIEGIYPSEGFSKYMDDLRKIYKTLPMAGIHLENITVKYPKPRIYDDLRWVDRAD